MIPALRQLWRSVGFRLAFYYGLLVAITMLASLAIVYMQTVGVLQQRMVRQVAASVQQLVVRHEARGAEGVVLGCSELSYARPWLRCRAPIFDATEIHARAIVREMLCA